MKLLYSLTVSFLFTFSALSQGWETVGGGLNNNVYDMINFNGELFVGGKFWGEVKSWDGTSWTDYPSLIGISVPLTLSIYNDTLYTGGDFPGQGSQSRVYRLVNGAWEQVGEVFDHPAWSSTKRLITYDTLLISGGHFSSIGATSANNIAAWDGTTWNPMGAGLNGTIGFLEVHNNTLYATGSFMASGTDTTVRNIARWNGVSWECFDTNVVITTAYALKSYQGELLIGNIWNTIGGTDMNGIARWDGTNYVSMGDSIIKKVHEFHEFGNELYIAADLFGSSPWITERAILKWNGSGWDQIGELFNEWIMCLDSYDNMLYCGGQYSSPATHIGRYNPSLSVTELHENHDEIVKVLDLMGRETKERSNTVLIYVYSDGSTKRVFRRE